MGTVRTPAGGPPPPGYGASFVAGGNGAWVALGPGSIWTSPDGRTWTLASTTGLPLRPGDQISVLKRTAAGFIAVGANVPAGAQAQAQAQASPVVFLSANGLDWQRLGAQQLRLAAGTAQVAGLSGAAVNGSRILIAGDVTVTTGKPGRTRTIPASAAWLSTDGGRTWTLAVRPGRPTSGAQALTSGAQPLISGWRGRHGFVLLRPATAAKKPAVDVYRSPNGTAWTFAATLAAPAGFTAGLVNGGPGRRRGHRPGGPDPDRLRDRGRPSWRQDPAFGAAAAEDGLRRGDARAAPRGDRGQRSGPGHPPAAAHGAAPANRPIQVVMAGDPRRHRARTGRQRRRGRGRHAGRGGQRQRLPGRLDLRRRRQLVAARPSARPRRCFGRPGIQQLTSVTYGAAGWLAVGGVTTAAGEHPVVVSSADGQVW